MNVGEHPGSMLTGGRRTFGAAAGAVAAASRWKRYEHNQIWENF